MEIFVHDTAGAIVHTSMVKIPDSAHVHIAVKDKLYELYDRGFLAAGYELDFGKQKQAVEVRFYRGRQFRLITLERGNVQEAILTNAGYKFRRFSDTPFHFKQVDRLLHKIVEEAENSGYPFASVKLDSIKIRDHHISAILNYRSGPKYVFDSLIIKGNVPVKKAWLATYLGVNKGTLFEAKKYESIPAKIALLPYLSLSGPPDILYRSGKANVVLNLRDNKINTIDGIIGFLPNQGGEQKLLITGRLDLELYNLFRSGKELQIFWERLNVQSQDLNLQYYHPNLLNMPLGLGGKFFLHREDSTFLNRNFSLMVDFIPGPHQKMAFEADFFRSRVINTNTGQDQIPEVNDVNVNYYGLRYKVNKLDDIILPRSGWQADIGLKLGNKNILEDASAASRINDTIDTQPVQYSIKFSLDKYFRFSKHYVLRSGLNGGFLISEWLFTNDLYRLGGFRTIRGFNENQFFANRYIYSTIELRIISTEGTYFFAFYDQGYVRNEVGDGYEDFPLGFGVGVNFSTNSGMFNFVFAMGHAKQQDIDFSQSKIHFGYTARF